MLLDRLVPMIFPTRAQTLGNRLSYYWTIWQSEWATDLICQDSTIAREQMDDLLRHALITGTSDRVLRYTVGAALGIISVIYAAGELVALIS